MIGGKNLVFDCVLSKSLNVDIKNILKIITICSVIIFLIPTAIAKDITFSELGMATEFTSGMSGTTSTGIFYSEANDYPLSVNVNAYFRTYYKLKVYLNDAQIDSGQIIGNVNFSVTFKNESLKTGKNSIYIVGEPWGVWPFGVQFGNLIIYGTSNISSPDIFLPPPILTSTPTPSPISTPIQTPSPIAKDIKDITFSELGVATEFTSGRSVNTPVGTFYSTSNENPLEITVNAYYLSGYQITIYLNDAPIETGRFTRSSTLTTTVPKANVRDGINTIYINGKPTDLFPFGSDFGNLIIYGTSKIRSPNIFLPPQTPTSIPTTTAPTILQASPTATPSASVNLHGEKTDVVLGENVLLKLSAINIIGNPIMHVQVIIIPPNGWSVTSSEFSKSGAGQYVTMYDLKPEDGSRDIEVKIMPNQIGDNFEVKGRIIYYFEDNLSTREDHTLNLPIKVRERSETLPSNPKSPIPYIIYIFAFIIILLFIYSNIGEQGRGTKKEIVGTPDEETKQEIFGTPAKVDYVFENTIKFLNGNEVYFRYGKNKVEKDYQQDLEHKLALLTERFGYTVLYEAKEGRHRIDFLVDDKVGIEMKVHKGGTQVEKELFYQITKYGKLFPKIIGVVLNDSDTENQQLKNEIEQRLKDQNVIERKDYEIIVKTIRDRYTST